MPSGGFGQCHVPRRAACVGERARSHVCGVLNAEGGTQGLPGASATAVFIQEAFSGKEPEAKARLAVGQLALLAAAAALRECAPAVAGIPRARGCMSRMEACWERASSGPTKPGSARPGIAGRLKRGKAFSSELEMLMKCS